MTVPPFESLSTRGRLLVVEEASVLREIGILLLRRAGYETIAVANGQEALAKAQTDAFDAIILNTDEPAVWDRTFLHKLGQTLSSGHIVGLLATPEPATAQALQACGVSAILTRPTNPAHLLEAIETVLGYGMTAGAPKFYHDAAAVDHRGAKPVFAIDSGREAPRLPRFAVDAASRGQTGAQSDVQAELARE